MEKLSLRIALTLVVACVAACAGSHDVNSTPPTIFFYTVAAGNVSPAEVRAQNYCARFGRSAIFRGLESSERGNRAAFSCGDATTAVPPPLAGSSAEPDGEE
jgi:hypothetical protein